MIQTIMITTKKVKIKSEINSRRVSVSCKVSLQENKWLKHKRNDYVLLFIKNIKIFKQKGDVRVEISHFPRPWRKHSKPQPERNFK